MFRHNVAYDRETQTGPLAEFLGREERLEQMIERRLVHADAGVADGDEDVGSGAGARVVQGAQAVATQLAASKIPTVVAVSCNVATFARDAKILIDGGYTIDGVTPVDQFRHTPHVELVARFRR